MKVFKTATHGVITQEALYRSFIKSMELEGEYDLWFQAIVDEEIEVYK